jgi:putative Mn2+ efflux pump MntP
MVILTIVVIALGLAMDAFAVSIISGATYEQLKIRHALRMAVFFGVFQAIMPLIGSLAGITLRTCIASYDHWVAFILLSGVGMRMIYESFKIKPTRKNLNPSNILVLLVLSVATSIDALIIGITISLLMVPIAITVIVIGLVTFTLSYAGVYVGKRVGHFFENKIEALGGLILIGLGAKILLQHIVF